MHYNNNYHHHHNPDHHHHHHHSEQQQPKQQHQQPLLNSPQRPNRYQYRYAHDFDEIDERIFEYNNLNTNYNLVRSHLSVSPSPVREQAPRKNDNKKIIEYELDDKEFLDRYEYDNPRNPDDMLRLKWIDNGPRMSRIREHRNKRLINRLEVKSLKVLVFFFFKSLLFLSAI
jgi:hypothetical protein